MNPTLPEFWHWWFVGLTALGLVVIGVRDLATRTIARWHTAALCAACAVSTATMLVATPALWQRVAIGCAVGLALALALYLVHLVSGGIGFGDVLLAFPVGYVLGLHSGTAVLVGVEAIFVLGGAVGLVLLACGAGRKFRVPFAPFMLGGAVVGMLGAGLVGSWLG